MFYLRRKVAVSSTEPFSSSCRSCELRRDELQKKNEDLVAQYNALQKDMRLATDFRKQHLATKKKTVDELRQQRSEQRARLKEEAEALNLPPGLIQEQQERIEQLRSENRMQEAKCEEFKERFTQQLSKLESLEKQLRISEKEEREAVHNIKSIAEYERQMLTDEIEQNVESMTVNELQLERSQLDKLMKQNEVMQNRNASVQEKIDVLQDRVQDLSSELRDMKEEVSKRTQEVEQAKMTQQKLQMELKDCLMSYKIKWANCVNLRKNLAAVTEQYRQIPDQCDLLPEIREREMNRSAALDCLMQEAVIILRHILAHSEKATVNEWEMTRLLEILQTTSQWRPVSATTMEKRQLRTETAESSNQPGLTLNCKQRFDFC
ncbi:uncharacterized protein V6R79_004175 [Siganus canaliculatus]